MVCGIKKLMIPQASSNKIPFFTYIGISNFFLSVDRILDFTFGSWHGSYLIVHVVHGPEQVLGTTRGEKILVISHER